MFSLFIKQKTIHKIMYIQDRNAADNRTTPKLLLFFLNDYS